MGNFLIKNMPYLIIIVFIGLLVVFGREVKKEVLVEEYRPCRIGRTPSFKTFIRMIAKTLQHEGIEVSREVIIEVISFCILGGVNPQKIRFKEGKFKVYWQWEYEHRGVMREVSVKNPEQVVSRILELAHEIGITYAYNIRKEYASYIRLKYMKHVPDIWWFSDIFEKDV